MSKIASNICISYERKNQHSKHERIMAKNRPRIPSNIISAESNKLIIKIALDKVISLINKENEFDFCRAKHSKKKINTLKVGNKNLCVIFSVSLKKLFIAVFPRFMRPLTISQSITNPPSKGSIKAKPAMVVAGGARIGHNTTARKPI